MTPEERAERITNSDPHYTAVLAAAIRAAENDALERAAKVAGETEGWGDCGCAELAASAIRELKHPGQERQA